MKNRQFSNKSHQNKRLTQYFLERIWQESNICFECWCQIYFDFKLFYFCCTIVESEHPTPANSSSDSISEVRTEVSSAWTSQNYLVNTRTISDIPLADEILQIHTFNNFYQSTEWMPWSFTFQPNNVILWGIIRNIWNLYSWNTVNILMRRFCWESVGGRDLFIWVIFLHDGEDCNKCFTGWWHQCSQFPVSTGCPQNKNYFTLDAEDSAISRPESLTFPMMVFGLKIY